MQLERGDCPYACHYCEENVWRLAARPEIDPDRARVLIITNPSKRCALFAQAAAPTPDDPVVWDYHVILLTQRVDGWWVCDLDSTLPFPIDFRTYATKTFVPSLLLPAPLQPMFRVVDASVYLREFSSDRSHMRGADGGWLSEPPEWPEILVEGGALTLSAALDLESGAPGEVMGLASLLETFAGVGSDGRPDHPHPV